MTMLIPVIAGFVLLAMLISTGFMVSRIRRTQRREVISTARTVDNAKAIEAVRKATEDTQSRFMEEVDLLRRGRVGDGQRG